MILQVTADHDDDDGTGRRQKKLQFTLCVGGVDVVVVGGADEQHNVSDQFPFVRF